ncbi:VOC family protein [Aestuariivirga litoralis]|uniref:Bleomycin resistance protein n=1 Tax=Aestuariivirga litoralis TaxID=2650924 RepID=A0A2W2BU90_9HYPH|nr:VOC family protein [Aestuariivirga litoralis]PZF77046.1 VOC family protein [Aestuariivirga litoralis]
MRNTVWSRLVPELVVSDITASLRFYTGIIGFRTAYDRPEDGFAYLDLDGAQLMLEQTDEPWLTGPMERPFGRGINLQIEVAAIAPLLQRLADHGWPLFRAARDDWYRCGGVLAGNRQFMVQCPDGYLLRFFEDLGERPLG